MSLFLFPLFFFFSFLSLSPLFFFWAEEGGPGPAGPPLDPRLPGLSRIYFLWEIYIYIKSHFPPLKKWLANFKDSSVIMVKFKSNPK